MYPLIHDFKSDSYRIIIKLCISGKVFTLSNFILCISYLKKIQSYVELFNFINPGFKIKYKNIKGTRHTTIFSQTRSGLNIIHKIIKS
jgi:hypothetical protein